MTKVIRKPGPGKKAIEKLIRQAKGYHTQVGFLPSAKYESGTPVAYVAMIHENGSPEKNIAPRPMFAPTVMRCKGKWLDMARGLGAKVMRGEVTTAQALEQISLVAASDVAESIKAVTEPALKEKTIKARMSKRKRGHKVGSFTKPLYETGRLFTDVTSTPVSKGSVKE